MGRRIMNRTKKKKKRSISFLIVPDDHAEPIVFKFSAAALRVMAVVAALLLIHVLAGGVFYFLYFKAHKENVALRAEKVRLENENKKVRVIAQKLHDLQQFTQKLKVSLGIEAGAALDESGTTKLPSTVPTSEVRRDYFPLPENVTLPAQQDDRFRRVTAVKTVYHLLYENLPTLLPVNGIITLGFHARNYHEGASQKLHLGIDIAARRGSVIKAGICRLDSRPGQPDHHLSRQRSVYLLRTQHTHSKKVGPRAKRGTDRSAGQFRRDQLGSTSTF